LTKLHILSITDYEYNQKQKRLFFNPHVQNKLTTRLTHLIRKEQMIKRIQSVSAADKSKITFSFQNKKSFDLTTIYSPSPSVKHSRNESPLNRKLRTIFD
jgi:hypothetical protein